MSTFDGAIIREQGMTFGIMVVKNHVLLDLGRRDGVVADASRTFGGIPTVLMSQDARGTPTFYGRDDIVRFMARVSLSRVPWKRYRITDAA
jgi:hypothetical protein